MNGLDANVVVDCDDGTFVALSNDTVIVVFDNLIFQTCGNCRGRSSSLSGIVQIVTSTVRIDVALTLSRRRSLLFRQILVVLAPR